MNKIVVILGISILVVLGGVLLSGSSQNNNQPTIQETIQSFETPTKANDNSQSGDSAKQGNVKEFIIESKGLNFTPNEIKVNIGDRVKVTYKNTFGRHDLVIDEFNARTKLIDAGQEDTVEFVADRIGSFEFYCSVPGHREAGMKGTLIVE